MPNTEVETFDTAPPTRRRVGRRHRRDRLDAVLAMLQRIDTALIVRDPGTARSADAYEGLRRQVVAAAGDRRRHVVQLTELAEALRRGDDIAALQSRVEEWLLQANVAVVTDISAEDVFELTGPDDGIARMFAPAYVDGTTGAVIRRGLGERVNAGRREAPGSTSPSEHTTAAPDATAADAAIDVQQAAEEDSTDDGQVSGAERESENR